MISSSNNIFLHIKTLFTLSLLYISYIFAESHYDITYSSLKMYYKKQIGILFSSIICQAPFTQIYLFIILFICVKKKCRYVCILQDTSDMKRLNAANQLIWERTTLEKANIFKITFFVFISLVCLLYLLRYFKKYHAIKHY